MNASFPIASCTGSICDTSRMLSRPRLLILGASGRLGQVLAAQLTSDYEIIAPGRSIVDLAEPETLKVKLGELAFDLALNAAALTSPDVCEEQPELARRINAESPLALAELCADRGARLIHFSTDYVFAGNGCVFLDEHAPTASPSVYGQTKAAGENAVLAACPAALVGRVSWLFGPGGGGVPETVLQRVRAGEPLGFIEDKWSVPTSTLDIAQWVKRLLTDLAQVSGILHLCNTGVATWRDYAQVTLDCAHQHGLLDRAHAAHGLKLRDFPQFKAPRPPFTVMSNNRLAFLLGETPRRWQDALEAHIISRVR
ncbi:dTDP-4-dehydrorhamnose reductase [Prosthecobacter debontii]|uniref:dTDP-4-dehydrorhamnose reductase n=1 Tax=Prosthecobacter debontii TaxID=48467 RepID=A0A1T4Y9J8_9BACT|nr:NAD(P)-dependent oxidoreductase [Prosthecobacter debontii]SKA98188.1 dTDP-4-dehydrorhamnose reductase [Prosthecobacter debontii]